jgi:hypothetical protein
MATYSQPKLTRVGSLQELTLTTINKTGNPSGDVIVYKGTDYPVPGSSLS